MKLLFDVLYVLTILSSAVSVGVAMLRFSESRSPLTIKYIRTNLTFTSFLIFLSLSYVVVFNFPAGTFQAELFFDTFFFALYALMALFFPPFLSELVQRPSTRGQWWLNCFALSGLILPLLIHSLIEGTAPRVEALRFWLNGVYLWLFLGTMAFYFFRVFWLGRKIDDSWKRSTIQGTVVLFFAGLPFFIIDGLWPLIQEQWHLLPRGGNLHLILILAWNLFFTVRWVKFSDRRHPPLVPGGDTIDHPLFGLLTQREKDVARLLVQGLSNQEVADRLSVAVGTIKALTYRIYNKVGASSRRELAKMTLTNQSPV